MKLRLVSDLHIDVNDRYGVSLTENGDNDVFTLIAGDICGTVDDTISWINRNVRKGAFCAGNHIVYNPKAVGDWLASKVIVPIEDLKDSLHNAFPPESGITFFDYDVGVMSKEIDDGVLLVSDVMYTDYRLKIPGINETGDYKFNMRMAEPRGMGGSYLNDFVYGYTRKKMYAKEKWDDGESRFGTPRGIWRLRAKYYRDHHLRAWKEVTRIVEENPDKDIVLMTHHCLSPKCISEDYVNDRLNASYVSDKERWIKKHPNIKLILSGHVHHRAHFKVGNTLYVLNPLGYCRDTMTQYNPETGKHEMWTPNCFVDTKTWNLTYEPYENGKWNEVRMGYISRYAAFDRFF